MSVEIQSYLSAASDLLRVALAEARQVDPVGVDGLALAIRAGAMLTLRSTFAPSTGLAHIVVEVIEPNGQSHVLMSTELTKKPH